jgi:hypothetical protein
MTKTICGTAALLTMCIGFVLADGPLQTQPDRVGNPYLVIRREGVEVIAEGFPFGRTVNVRDLEKTLIELPVTAWPYGRVVGLSDISIREPDGSDERPINDNRRAALAILKTLQVRVERWPSG